MFYCEATRARPVLDIPGFWIFGGSFNLAKPFLVLASCCWCITEYSSRRMFMRISMDVLMYSISVVASASRSFFLSLASRSSL